MRKERAMAAQMIPTTARRLAAEFLGTFVLVLVLVLVLGGCGSAVLAAGLLSPAKVHLGIGSWGSPSPRAHRADDGLRRQAHLRGPLQPRCHPRPRGVSTRPVA